MDGCQRFFFFPSSLKFRKSHSPKAFNDARKVSPTCFHTFQPAVTARRPGHRAAPPVGTSREEKTRAKRSPPEAPSNGSLSRGIKKGISSPSCPHFHAASRDSNRLSSGPELGCLIRWLVLPRIYVGEEGKEAVKSFCLSYWREKTAM